MATLPGPAPYRMVSDSQQNSVLAGITALGGLWTFVNGVFTLIFGMSILMLWWSIFLLYLALP